MNTTIKFSARDFRRGVNDTLTLAPIRTVVREFAGKHILRAKDSPRSGRNVSAKNNGKKSSGRS